MGEYTGITKWLGQYFDEVTPREFYRAIFPAGELDVKGSFTKGRYTGIVVAVTSERRTDGKPKVKRYTVTDDLDTVDEVAKTDDFCLCSPISYAGKQRTAQAARYLYAIAVDVDHIRERDGKPWGLIDLWNGHIQRADRIPKPSYIVSSGTGIHLYYVLEKPIPMFPDIAKELQHFKHGLTALIWNEGVVNIRDDRDIQQEGIYQGFRMPGTITKTGGRARAFLTGEKVTLEYLNGYLDEEYQVKGVKYKPTLTRAEAKEKYPEWYERRVVQGKPRNKWHTSRNVYDWWKREILKGGRVGHRYFCIAMLAVYAEKCSMYDQEHNPHPVTREELEKDAFEIGEFFETLTDDESNHFTNDDVLAALGMFEEKWITYTREAIEYRSGITIPGNKRNGRPQQVHLTTARAIKKTLKDFGWMKKEGRPTMQAIVEAWQQAHPDGKKADCIRDTGLSKPTVYKHWK